MYQFISRNVTSLFFYLFRAILNFFFFAPAIVSVAHSCAHYLFKNDYDLNTPNRAATDR